MFIRQVKKQRSKTSKVFYQYTLCQTSRIEGKVKQNSILYLGSDNRLEDKDNRAIVLNYLKAKIFNQPDLFSSQISNSLRDLASSYYEKYLLKYGEDAKNTTSIPPAPDKADFQSVDISSLEVKQVKTFGSEHLCKQTLEHLELSKCLADLGFNATMISRALLSIAARAIFRRSEYKTVQFLETNSALKACYDIQESITHKQLYHIADKLYTHKNQIDTFVYDRITKLFDLEDKLVIFDISNTYFETRKTDSSIAKHGKSKEKRSDCPLVVFTGVINAEGFIRHSNIYQGNTPDTATLKDMIKDLKAHSKADKHTVVIDAGIATEDNLEYIKGQKLDYVCVSRKRIKDYPLTSESTTKVLTNRGKNPVELAIFKPEGFTDIWMYVQSEDKRTKEVAMAEKLHQRFAEELDNIAKAIHKKGGTKTLHKVYERIGRVKQKHHRISGQYDINVTEQNNKATHIGWRRKKTPQQKDKENGVYFIRTSYSNPKEEDLWKVYNTIREVESTFRCLKTDLNIRPIHHQLDTRVQSHIYLSILAYQLVNTIRYMLKAKGIHHDWSNILRIMNTHTIQTIVLPTKTKVLNIRKPSKPIEQVQQIYDATSCKLTQTPIKKYVVYH